MKKQFCVFLSALLLLCAVICPFAAGEPSSGGGSRPSDSGGPANPGSSADPGGSAPADVSAGNPEHGLRIGNATVEITDITLWQSQMSVLLLYRNEGAQEYSYSDLFWLTLSQGDKNLNRDEQSVGIFTSRRGFANGDGAEFYLSFDLIDYTTMVKLTLDSFDEGKAVPVSFWFNMETGSWGTKEQAETGLTYGKRDGSIGTGPAPKPEAFDHPMSAALYYSPDENASLISTGHPFVQMTESGQYTVTIESARYIRGIYGFIITVNNPNDNPLDRTYLDGHTIRIDEILVDGKPVSFIKNCTFARSTPNAERTEAVNHYRNTVLYHGANPDPKQYSPDYYYWDGDSADPVLIVVNPEDFAAFRNLSVTFSYGVFE